MTQLQQILNDVSFQHAEDYYYKYHHYDPNRKIIGLFIFFDYFNSHLQELKNNIDILSKMATLFADEPDFLGIYTTICEFIKECINSRNTQPNAEIFDDYLFE